MRHRVVRRVQQVETVAVTAEGSHSLSPARDESQSEFVETVAAFRAVLVIVGIASRVVFLNVGVEEFIRLPMIIIINLLIVIFQLFTHHLS